MSLTLEPDFSGDGDIVFGGVVPTQTFRIDSDDLGQDDGEAERHARAHTLGAEGCE